MLTISLVIGGFGAYHWIICLLGRTTLETCAILDGYQPRTWELGHNMEVVFGTRNIVLAMLPISRNLKYLGYEWDLEGDTPDYQMVSMADQDQMVSMDDQEHISH